MNGRPSVNEARPAFPRFFVSVTLIACVGYAGPLLAQERDPTVSPQQPERRHRARADRGQPGRRGERRPGLRVGRLLGGHLLQRLPEDEGPLTPDQEVELMDFVRAHVPEVHRSLEQLRERDPAAFEQRLQDAAPRLRQLRRIFERDPELGANLVRYSENLHRIRRARWAWRNSEEPEARRRLRAAVRRMLAQNLRIEVAVLEDQAQQLEQQRDERVDAAVERWQSDDIDVAGESEELREVVRTWRAAQTDEERQALAGELRRISSERVDRRIARLRNRAARLRENAVEEVDRRMQRWTEHAERGPRTRPAFKHDKGRKREQKSERDRPPRQQP
ncbi:MAG: hypothetical protein ACE5I3_01160 [Phycisphaerae bacterium]